MSKLDFEQSKFCADIFSNYFDRFSRIDEYMRDQKMGVIAERPASLPGMGPEEDLFSNFDVHPQDMNFKIVEISQENWDSYIQIVSSHANMTSIPGRNFRFAVEETNTKKWVGFVRLGSPVINMKPRNELLKGVFTQTKEGAAAFNNTSIMGFAIVPAQPFGYNYLGGKLLAGICCSHTVREALNRKYDMNTCLFETTSLYGSTKSTSQYDGMKPYIRFGGLTDSDFVPMMHGQPFETLKEYVEGVVGEVVDPDASSRKLKLTNAIIALVKQGLKGSPEYDKFIKTITNAKSLTEQKRYYYSNYGFKNFADVSLGRTDKLIPDKENYDKFHLENIIDWWKRKATNRYENLKSEGKLRTEQEIWGGDKELEIIR